MKSIAIIDRGRGPELAGTRITIYTILPSLELGWSPTRIAEAHEISEEQVRALMEYFDSIVNSSLPKRPKSWSESQEAIRRRSKLGGRHPVRS